jgi:E1-E2 ATPase
MIVLCVADRAVEPCEHSRTMTSRSVASRGVSRAGRMYLDRWVVRSGHSYVDQATITGESTPVNKTAGASVYARNQSGTLEITAERVRRDTSFGKIIEAVESAERSRAPFQKTARPVRRPLGLFRARLCGDHPRHHSRRTGRLGRVCSLRQPGAAAVADDRRQRRRPPRPTELREAARASD